MELVVLWAVIGIVAFMVAIYASRGNPPLFAGLLISFFCLGSLVYWLVLLKSTF
jgi:hypothetical protein